MKAALQNYHARMQRVLDYIDRHLDGDLDLETVSRVAAFSKFHFHRQFTATFGLSVHRYVQLARMKRASHRLASKNAQSVTDIAMDAGYDAPDAFARAFRQRLGQSPSSFRKSPDWAPWLAAFGPLDNARSKLMQITYTRDDVTIREVPPTPVAIMEHRGDRATLARHHPAVHRLAQGRRLVARDKPDLHGLSFREDPRGPGRLQHGHMCRDRAADRRRMMRRSRLASSLGDAARCCACQWGYQQSGARSDSTSTVSGFRPAARKRVTSRSIANDGFPSSRTYRSMKLSRNCFCR